MRLLSLRDGIFKLEEFYSNIPPYAILSHTWGADEDEITFTDIMDDALSCKEKPGLQKLRFCASTAAGFSIMYFWIDTCCIDKSSSTELSEAINSMFRWYRNAAYCFVYLSDISRADCGNEMTSYNDLVDGTFINVASPIISENVLRGSRWFTRGWTLQELLAPKYSQRVLFYTSDAQYLGDRGGLSVMIAAVTGIPAELLSEGDVETYSTDERLKWAKGRSTKREEDEAYSLLGIFGIHMPLIYGEGKDKAMFRLLQESKAAERRRYPDSPRSFGGYVRDYVGYYFEYYNLTEKPNIFVIGAIIYILTLVAIFLANIARENRPIVAPYVRSKVRAIVEMRLIRELCTFVSTIKEVCTILTAKMMSSLAIAITESFAIMLVISGMYVIYLCGRYCLPNMSRAMTRIWMRMRNTRDFIG